MRRVIFALLLTNLALASCATNNRAGNRETGIAPQNSRTDAAVAGSNNPLRSCLNLNTASADELMRLPGVGEVIARRIIEYRERRGGFRRPEEIIIVEGFSERRYRAIAEQVCVK